tara:strand:- start:72 stop:314 length:243 start_codon:yes stop_codon:yes gene_type:complete
MSKIKVSKHIRVDVEFTDYKSLKNVFNEIMEELRLGRGYDRRKKDGSIYQYHLELLTNMDYEEIMIDGKWCQVFQSKMNN